MVDKDVATNKEIETLAKYLDANLMGVQGLGTHGQGFIITL